jgi:hypothetical protein
LLVKWKRIGRRQKSCRLDKIRIVNVNSKEEMNISISITLTNLVKSSVWSESEPCSLLDSRLAGLGGGIGYSHLSPVTCHQGQ